MSNDFSTNKEVNIKNSELLGYVSEKTSAVTPVGISRSNHALRSLGRRETNFQKAQCNEDSIFFPLLIKALM